MAQKYNAKMKCPACRLCRSTINTQTCGHVKLYKVILSLCYTKNKTGASGWPSDAGIFKVFSFPSLINPQRGHTESAAHYQAVKRFRVIPTTLTRANSAVKLTGSKMLERLRNAPGGTFNLIRTLVTIMKTNYQTHCVGALKRDAVNWKGFIN